MQFVVTLQDELGRQAEAEARREGISVSALLSRAVEQHLEERQRRKAYRHNVVFIGSKRVDQETARTVHNRPRNGWPQDERR